MKILELFIIQYKFLIKNSLALLFKKAKEKICICKQQSYSLVPIISISLFLELVKNEIFTYAVWEKFTFL